MLNVWGWVIRKSLNYRGGTRYKSCRLEAGCKSKTILWARHSEPRRPCGGRMARKINTERCRVVMCRERASVVTPTSCWTAAKASLRKAVTKGFYKWRCFISQDKQTNKQTKQGRNVMFWCLLHTCNSPFGLCKSGWLIQNQTVLRLSDKIFKGLNNVLTSYYRFWMV